MERQAQLASRTVPTEAVGFKLRDLLGLLKTIPKPDPEYWDTLEEINRTQPRLPVSRRER